MYGAPKFSFKKNCLNNLRNNRILLLGVFQYFEGKGNYQNINLRLYWILYLNQKVPWVTIDYTLSIFH